MPVEPIGRCFAPVIDEQTAVLILGSLPGQRSLSAGEYYAHPQNQFWRLLGAIIGEDLLAIDYGTRLETLTRHRIGLWDTVAQARRSGSLDSAMEDISPNDLAAIVSQLPVLRLIAFNGQKAAAIGRRQLLQARAVDTVLLPSSSPAFTLSFDRKRDLWLAALGPVLGLQH